MRKLRFIWKMVVKFEVLIEKKKMCSLGLMRFDQWMWFLMVHLEELEMKKLLWEKKKALVDYNGRIELRKMKKVKKNEKDGLI
ncbi:hypothetical protein Tco_0884610 [Tanacetum coccineum]